MKSSKATSHGCYYRMVVHTYHYTLHVRLEAAVGVNGFRFLFPCSFCSMLEWIWAQEVDKKVWWLDLPTSPFSPPLAPVEESFRNHSPIQCKVVLIFEFSRKLPINILAMAINRPTCGFGWLRNCQARQGGSSNSNGSKATKPHLRFLVNPATKYTCKSFHSKCEPQPFCSWITKA